MKRNLRLVRSEEVETLSLGDHDMMLPLLGKMRFLMRPSDDDGVYLIYIRDSDFNKVNCGDTYIEGIPTKPYCYGKVKPSQWDAFFNNTFERRVRKKLAKLKSWLIEQDILLGQIQGSSRKVML